MVCPFCGAKGNCAAHGSYQRSLLDIRDSKVSCGRVEIKRVRCESCGHTHAIIPDYIVPYSSYSLFFILRVLAAYFLRLKTVEQLCEQYQISPSTLYQWKLLFLSHKEIWLGVLKDADTTPTKFIQSLSAASYSADFGWPFFLKTARSFLQNHRDAAFSRHAVFWSDLI